LRSETIDPRFKVPDRPSKLDPFAEHLAAWLRREMGRSRKQKGSRHESAFYVR